MRIYAYLKNNSAKLLHPDPIWNDGALGFFEEAAPSKNIDNKKNKNKTSRYEISSWSEHRGV